MSEKRTMHHYNCLGCGKSYNTYKYYPEGWICLECRPTTKVIVKCSECGCDVPVKWGTYRLKDPNIPWRCRACNDKYRNAVYDAKSDEEKKAFVESQAARIRKYYEDMTPEERELNRQHRKEGWEKRRQDGTADYIFAKMKEGKDRWMNSMTQEKYSQWRIGIAQNYRRAIDEDPETYFEVQSSKMTQSEMEVANQLNALNLPYVYNFPTLKEDPKLLENFNGNPATGNSFADPTHFWDFCIITRDSKFLLDVDGAIHDLSAGKMATNGRSELYDIGENHRFLDGLRKYQTDGLPAYVIQAYDGTITDDTDVVNVKTEEIMCFSQLLAILSFANMGKTEQDELLK